MARIPLSIESCIELIDFLNDYIIRKEQENYRYKLQRDTFEKIEKKPFNPFFPDDNEEQEESIEEKTGFDRQIDMATGIANYVFQNKAIAGGLQCDWILRNMYRYQGRLEHTAIPRELKKLPNPDVHDYLEGLKKEAIEDLQTTTRELSITELQEVIISKGGKIT